jgi:type II secretory pathway component PulF
VFGMSRKQLIWFCHSGATMLDAGLPVIRVLEVLSSQAPGRVGAKIARMKRAVEAGDNLTEAAGKQHIFPPLFLQLVSVGEESGTLERTLAELGRYYEFQQRLWRSFVARVTLPVVQYVAAVAIVSFATHIINSLMDRPSGFARIMVPGYGVPLAVIFSYVFLLKPLGATRAVHEVLLRVPVVGNVTRSLALARFSLVMQLLLESATPIGRGLVRAAEATDNGAFAARGKRMAAAVEGGATLTEALERTGLFPREYVEVVRIAEESGKMSERFGWLAAHHADRAEFALQALGTALAWLVWLIVAGFIISFIFKIFSQYVGTLNSLMS